MEPGPVEFSQAFLDQLRRDLKSLAPGRLEDFDIALGRRPGFFRQLKAHRLKMKDAFAAIRFMDFSPREYFTRHQASAISVPAPVPGFLGRYRALPTDRIKLGGLAPLTAWGFTVRLSEKAPVRMVDLSQRLKSLGVEVGPDEIYKYATLIFGLILKEKPETIDPETAEGLVRSLLLLAEIFPKDRPHQRAAAQLLDLGFHLEKMLDLLDLRHRLFAAAAEVCSQLGHLYDGIWCARQASHCAIFIPDVQQALVYRELMTRIALGAKRSNTATTASGNLLGQAQQDQEDVLATILANRETSSIPAAELDRRLGGQRAFANALGHRGSMPIWRWKALVDLLDISPFENLDRAAAWAATPPPVGRLFENLKLALKGKHIPKFTFQKKLLGWCQDVCVSDSEEPLTMDLSVFSGTEVESQFQVAARALADYSSNLPKAIRPDDIVELAEGLWRLSFALRCQGLFSDSADFLSASLVLLERSGHLAKLAPIYRLGAYLAVDLGNREIAAIVSRRAIEIDLALHSVGGLSLSLYSAAFVEHMAGRFRKTLHLYDTCAALTKEPNSLLEEWRVHLAKAAVLLKTEKLEAAGVSFRLAERDIDEISASDLDLVEFYLVKAELLSRTLTDIQEPVKLLEQASPLLIAKKHARELMLVGLAKCDHFLRHNQPDKARQEARDLLPLTAYLGRNPIGIRAVHELVRRSLLDSMGHLDIETARGKLRFPYLPS